MLSQKYLSMPFPRRDLLFLQGIVFLLILISGLCCMAGIDTPTRFETPQDS